LGVAFYIVRFGQDFSRTTMTSRKMEKRSGKRTRVVIIVYKKKTLAPSFGHESRSNRRVEKKIDDCLSCVSALQGKSVVKMSRHGTRYKHQALLVQIKSSVRHFFGWKSRGGGWRFPWYHSRQKSRIVPTVSRMDATCDNMAMCACTL
jgi:hypothetical protein